MAQTRYTDQELFQLVLAADEEAFLAGDDPSDRAWKVPMTVMRQIGFESYIAGVPGPPAM